jgi:hypothetical protein
MENTNTLGGWVVEFGVLLVPLWFGNESNIII